jgi:hypothetical protein
LGSHEGGYGPFYFEVSDLLREKDNFLCVRVISPIVASDQLIDGLGQCDMPHWRGAIAAGIWQSVTLSFSSKLHLSSPMVEADLKAESFGLGFILQNLDVVPCEGVIELVLRLGDDLVAKERVEFSCQPGAQSMRMEIELDSMAPWSPEQATLYDFSLKLHQQGRVLDELDWAQGFRELSLEGDQFVLNGKPVYLKAAFFEGLYPEGLAFPDSEAMARKEIALAKAAGFNMIRPWRKPPPPMWLDLCDEMGMMVVGGLPIECMNRWPSITPQLEQRIEGEIRSAVERDRNRTCVVQWELFNEIWRDELKRMKHRMAMLTRTLDPTRLILDESGGFADGANLYLPGEYVPTTFNDIHIYPGAPLSYSNAHKQFEALGRPDEDLVMMGLDPKVDVNQHAVSGRLTFVSEIGYGSTPDLVKNNAQFQDLGNHKTPAYRYHRMLEDSLVQVLGESGVSEVFPDVSSFTEAQQQVHGDATRRMIESIRINPVARGYAVHALTDGDWILGAGLLDLFRDPKLPYEAVKQANSKQMVVLQLNAHNVYQEQGLELRVFSVNESEAVMGTWTVNCQQEGCEPQQIKAFDGDLASGVEMIFSENLDLASFSGACHIDVRFRSAVSETELVKTESFRVFSAENHALEGLSCTVLKEEVALKKELEKWGVLVSTFDAACGFEKPLVVSDPKEMSRQMESTSDWVERGGFLLCLETIQRPVDCYWPGQGVKVVDLPFGTDLKHSLGLWIGVSHVVKEHPIFSDLPAGGNMGPCYENIWTPFSVQVEGASAIVSSISYGCYAEHPERQHHQGPEPFWHALDLGVVPHGEGRYLLNSLRLKEFMGCDPIADQVFKNMLEWACSDCRP